MPSMRLRLRLRSPRREPRINPPGKPRRPSVFRWCRRRFRRPGLLRNLGCRGNRGAGTRPLAIMFITFTVASFILLYREDVRDRMIRPLATASIPNGSMAIFRPRSARHGLQNYPIMNHSRKSMFSSSVCRFSPGQRRARLRGAIPPRSPSLIRLTSQRA